MAERPPKTSVTFLFDANLLVELGELLEDGGDVGKALLDGGAAPQPRHVRQVVAPGLKKHRFE